MLYRICTENKNREQVEAIVAKRFDGFTVFEAKGYWKGQDEASLVIEVIPPEINEDNILGLAEDIKALNSQESVLIQELSCVSYFV